MWLGDRLGLRGSRALESRLASAQDLTSQNTMSELGIPVGSDEVSLSGIIVSGRLYFKTYFK
jgi:hypothetical protein